MTQNTKKWFEANYLDGDKVQDGQMLSSEVCLEAVTTYGNARYEEGVKAERERIYKEIESGGNPFFRK